MAQDARPIAVLIQGGQGPAGRLARRLSSPTCGRPRPKRLDAGRSERPRLPALRLFAATANRAALRGRHDLALARRSLDRDRAVRRRSGRSSSAPPWAAGSRLLAARHLWRAAARHAPAGIVLIAPAVDFTERLMWDRFPEEHQAAQRAGDRRLSPALGLFGRSLPDHQEADRGWAPASALRCSRSRPAARSTSCRAWRTRRALEPCLRLVEHLPGDSVSLTLIKDGDHRLSRPEDLERLIAAIEAIA